MRPFEAGLAVGAAFLGFTFFVPAQARADRMSTSPEQAYDLGEIPSPRPVAMGGALNALGVSTTALYLNPANMPLARVYHLEALAALDPEASRQTYGFAIVDSLLNSGHFSGGVGGTWSRMDPNGLDRMWTDLRAALALPIGDYLSVGATGRWLHVDQAMGAGPFGASRASDGGSDPLLNLITIDLGATATLTPGLRLAVVGHNLTNPGTALAPTTGAAGLGYFTPMFSLEADGMLDFTTWGSPRGRLMAGGEVFLANRYALRLGWRYDAGTQTNAPSFGLGYIDPRWSLELAYRRDIVSDHPSSLGVVSLRYFYDAIGDTTPIDQPDSL